MCLGIPGQIIAIDPHATPRMGTVSFSGVQKQVCLEWLPEAKEGDYVIVHVGFALSIVDEDEAQQTLRDIATMRRMAGEDPGAPDSQDTGERR